VLATKRVIARIVFSHKLMILGIVLVDNRSVCQDSVGYKAGDC
jgi:hypothetical protein